MLVYQRVPRMTSIDIMCHPAIQSQATTAPVQSHNTAERPRDCRDWATPLSRRIPHLLHFFGRKGVFLAAKQVGLRCSQGFAKSTGDNHQFWGKYPMAGRYYGSSAQQHPQDIVSLDGKNLRQNDDPHKSRPLFRETQMVMGQNWNYFPKMDGFKLELTQPVCPLASQVRLWKWSTTFEATAQSTSVFEVESCVGVHFSLGRDSHWKGFQRIPRDFKGKSENYDTPAALFQISGEVQQIFTIDVLRNWLRGRDFAKKRELHHEIHVLVWKKTWDSSPRSAYRCCPQLNSSMSSMAFRLGFP